MARGRCVERGSKLDSAGRITWMNERAEKDQLLMLPGRHFIEFVAAESRDLANESFQSTLGGKETQFEVRALRIDGTVRNVELQSSPLWKDGNVDGVLVFLRDVTERKQAQEMMAQAQNLSKQAETEFKTQEGQLAAVVLERLY